VVAVDDASLALLVLALVVVVFVWNKLPVGVVAILAALTLWVTDLVTTEQAVAGFGDPVVIFIATLFIVSEGIDSTGVTTWAGRWLIERAGTERVRVLVAGSLLSALLTSLITLNGAVAALLPLVVMLAVRIGTPPSQMLMPVVFAGSAGGLLMLMSSPVNVIVSDAAAESGEGPFAFFSFSLVGLPMLVGTIAICVLLGPRLLPRREPEHLPPDLALYASMLEAHYGLGRTAELVNRELGIAEVVVPPRSRLIGERVHPGMQRQHGLIILACQRLGRDQGDGAIELAEGDALVVHGPWSELDQLSKDRDVLLVDSPDAIRRQAVPWGARATRAVLVLASMVAMLASGQVPPAIAGLTAAVAMVLFRVVTVNQAFRSVSWETVVLVAALIPLSTAIQASGAADRIAGVLIDVVGPRPSPYLLLVAIFLLTATLGQVISNTATVLVIVPVAVAAAQAAGTSVRPVLMVVAIAGSAALLTPIATPGNMMIMSPAGYRFGDYWKLGLPIMMWWFVVALVVVPLVWSP
jgi:di/tricarboxylate transporter